MANRQSAKTNRQAVAAVEFAVMSPIMIFFMFAVIEVTNAIYLQQALTIAAYEGARVALVPGTDTSNVIAAGNRILEARNVIGAKISIEPNSFSSAAFGDPIRVEATAPAFQTGITASFFSEDQIFRASVTMMKER
jgi:Flp pilus assembly protein TadG